MPPESCDEKHFDASRVELCSRLSIIVRLIIDPQHLVAIRRVCHGRLHIHSHAMRARVSASTTRCRSAPFQFSCDGLIAVCVNHGYSDRTLV